MAEVVDGDTVKISVDGKVESIRIIGLDTPEVVDPRTPAQCFGREASAKAKELLAGQQVHLVADPTQDNRDKYDRLLRYVDRADGLDFGLMMIGEGYAHEYTYQIPYERQAAYKAAQTSARDKALGLWSSATCNGDTTQGASAVRQAPFAAPTTRPAATAQPTSRTGCDPAYPDVCIPPPPPDLDCKDVPYKRFRVLPPDPHRFDGNDKDGVACEN